jgi:hypothetical protein
MAGGTIEYPNPFGPADWDAWDAAERQLEEAAVLADQAEYCGIDCQQHREAIRLLREQLARLKQRFGRDVTVGGRVVRRE